MQDLLGAQIGIFVRAGKRVQMNSLRQRRKRLCLSSQRSLNELLYIIAIGELERAGQLTIDRVLDNDI